MSPSAISHPNSCLKILEIGTLAAKQFMGLLGSNISTEVRLCPTCYGLIGQGEIVGLAWCECSSWSGSTD